jgi:hypothetical protein
MVILGLIYLISPSHELRSESIDLKKISDRTLENFALIKSYSCQIDSSGELTDAALKNAGMPKTIRKGKSLNKIKNSLSHWYFDRSDILDSNPTAWMHKIWSYDGSYHGRFDKVNGLLYLQKKDPEKWDFLTMASTLLQPYAFLQRKASETYLGGAELLLSDMQKPDLWDPFLRAASLVPAQDMEGNILKVTYSGFIDHSTQKKFYWEIHFSMNQGGLPVYRARITEDGRTLSVFRVTKIGVHDLGQGKKFYYAQEASSEGYRFSKDDKPSSFGAMTLKDLKINDPQLESPEAFSVDPSSAKTIFDEDEKKVIHVPR